ncbi:MAG: hypothetical protein PUP92_06155 [Rhizonema sp. PD38]|nr:hypothetical protein [Rhizonema sp. PD38]
MASRGNMMMDVTKLTSHEIRQLGIETLALALGPAGTGLFIHQFEKGSGDYTQDRDKILGNPTIEEIVAEIKKRRESQVESLDTLPKFTSIKIVDLRQLMSTQIKQLGIDALTKALGVDGMTRFLRQLEIGGD